MAKIRSWPVWQHCVVWRIILCRYEVLTLQKVLLEEVIAPHSKLRKELILDFKGTDDAIGSPRGGYTRYAVTNLRGDARELYDNLHCARA